MYVGSILWYRDKRLCFRQFSNYLQSIQNSANIPLFTYSSYITAKTNCWSPNLLSSPHGRGCDFASYVWRWKRTKTKLVLNGCNVVGDAAITLKSEVHFNTPSQKQALHSGDGNEYHCNHGCNQGKRSQYSSSRWGTQPRATL